VLVISGMGEAPRHHHPKRPKEVARARRLRLRQRRGMHGMGNLETDIVPTLADIDAAAAELDARIKAFAKESFEQLPDVPNAQGFLSQWNAMVADWGAWKTAFWVDRWKRRNEVLAFRNRFNGLVGAWSALKGAAPTTVQTYKPGQTETSSPLSSLAKAASLPTWVVPVAVVGIGLAVATHLAGGVRALLPRGGTS